MSEIALAKINSFAHVAQQVDVSPEEPIFVLTGSQLQGIIKEAVKEAIQPLQDHVDTLEVTVARQQEDIASLKSTENLNFSDIRDLYTAIDEIDQRQQAKPQPLQKDRGEILRALLAANDGKMLRSYARKKMHLSESRFSELLAIMEDYIEVRPYHLNKNWKVLVLK